VRDPGAGIDPYRDAGGGERANAFLEIARRTTIGDEADIDAADVRTVQRRRDVGPARASRCMVRSTSANFDWRSSARRYRYVTSFWEFSI
jgi:hypothetical protein